MFIELVDEVICFLTNFIKGRENWFWALKQKNAHKKLKKKKKKKKTLKIG